jgi:hypothetical protein
MRNLRAMIALPLALAAVLIVGGYALRVGAEEAAPHQTSPDHLTIAYEEIEWAAGPPSLPTGSRMTVLQGDMGAPGPFTARLVLPANYRIPPHWHPGNEHVTILSGTVYMGLGERFDATNGKALTPGGFAFMKAGTRHYAWTTDKPAVIQLHGVGPWGITYVNPADDPRNR